MGTGKTEQSEESKLAKAIRTSYKNEREQLDTALQTCGYIGLSISEFYKCSNREFTMYQFGAMKRIEESVNVEYAISKWQAGEISLAVWGDKKFKNDKTPEIDLTSKILPDSDVRRIKKAQKATLDRIKRQYGVDLEHGGFNNG